MAEEIVNSTVKFALKSVWVEASNLPKRQVTTHGQDWDRSEKIWLRVKSKYRYDEITKMEILVHPAYTDIGYCCWPKKPIAFHPKDSCENPATTVEWGDDEPFYTVHGAKLEVSHWLPLIEPVPPGEVIPEIHGTSTNNYTLIDGWPPHPAAGVEGEGADDGQAGMCEVR